MRMRRSFETRLRCPACRLGQPQLASVTREDAREIREGALTCADCGHVMAIEGGIVNLLVNPPEYVDAEAEGLQRFADVMSADGWDRERVMRLPEEPDGYWFCQATLMQQTLDTVPFQPAQTILDIGSNTCWATAAFAQHGLDATALDIATALMQGLSTADWHFEDKGVFFERALGTMFDMPFRDASFDYVWCCEVLHHNHRSALARTYEEIYRVLKPGGTLIVANEPLRTVMTPKINPGHEVAQFEGHEHAYMRHSYTRLARKAGFDIDVRGPRYHATFNDSPVTLTADMRYDQLFRAATVVASRRSPRLQRALLAGRAYVMGGTALHMICTKPSER
jgi:SAM-dependent methyltransferase